MLNGYTLELETQDGYDEERFSEIGVTSKGRYLIVITTMRGFMTRPVTAFDAPYYLIQAYLTEQVTHMALPKMPKFATEAEEAKWWFDHREELADDMVTAIRKGRLGEGSKARWARKQAERLQAEQQESTAPAEQRRAS